MPDRYDPKLSVRPTSDRNLADANKAKSAADNDPLVELARIVSGRSSHGGAGQPPRSRTVPAAADRVRLAAEPDVLGNLEAELLSDLQASFSTVKETFAAPPAPPPAPKADEPTTRAARPAETPSPQPKPAAPAVRAERFADVPPAEAAAPERPAGGRPPVIERADRPAPMSSQKPAAAQPPAPERTPQALRTSRSDRVDIPNMQLRSPPASSPPPPEAPARQSHSRWEKPAEPQKTPANAASRFAPPRAAAPATPPPLDFDTAEEELFGDGPPFVEAGETEGPEDELPFDEFDMVPGYGDEDLLPPYPDEELGTLVKRRRRRGLIVFAAVAAVVTIGGVSVIMFGAGEGGGSPPPIITADGSPTKITPQDNAAAEGDQNKLIYDRVGAADGEPDTTLLTPGDQPIADIPTADAGADNPISRVIIPAGPGFDAPVADQNAAVEEPGAAGAGEPIQPIGPRKVRTVVVKPDGTIVSSQAAEPGADATPPAVDVAPIIAEPVPPPPPTPPTSNDTMAIAGPGGAAANGELAITPIPETTGENNLADGAVVVAEPAPAPPVATARPPQPAPRPAPTIVATGGDRGPIDITPARPTPRPPAAAPTQTAAVTATGGMLVQVSSQRSEDAARATFRDLQSRYPGILGPYQVDIQRADLADRGIYFRARVGPFPPGDAQRLCDDLKAAGGDCILSRR